MRRLAIPAAARAGAPRRLLRPCRQTAGTLAELRQMRPDLQEAKVEQGLDQAMHGYRRFLEETPETAMTPEAMRRLADLQLEKQFGIRTGDAKPREMAAPQPASRWRVRSRSAQPGRGPRGPARWNPIRTSSSARPTGVILAATDPAALPADAVRGDADPKGPLEAIALYDRLLDGVPELPAQGPGPLPESAGVRRAWPHRRGHRDHGAPDRREPALRALRRGAVPARRVLLHAPKLPRCREAPTRPSSAWAPAPRTTSWRSTSLGGRSTSGNPTNRRWTSTWRCSTTRCRSGTTSIGRTARTTSDASPIPFASSVSASAISVVRKP